MERFEILREKRTKEDVSQEVLDKHDGKIELVGDYVNTNTKALFHCNVCGNEWKTIPSDILRGIGCPRCSKCKKGTKYDVSQRVHNKHNGNIELIGDYVNSQTKTQFHCNVCGHEWMAIPNSILQGHGCPQCKKIKLAKNVTPLETVIKKIKDIHGDALTLVDGYKKSGEKANFHCNICGLNWTPYVNDILKGTGCPRCSGTKKYTTEEAFEKIYKVHNGNISLIGDYINGKTKTQFHCNICGKTWEARPSDIIKGVGCPRCANNDHYSNEEFIQKIKELTNGKISPIEPYINTETPILFHCSMCGNEWRTTPHCIIGGGGCPKCGLESRSDKRRSSRDQVAQEVLDKHEGRIKLIGDYINANTKTMFHCNKCGNNWEAVPSSVLSGRGCPRCASSKGEDYITSWLEKNWSEDDWVAQKKFEDLKGTGNGLLSYDFYVPSKNLCIEFQGIQHYAPTKFKTNMDAEAQFVRQQEHDRRKKQYCQEHGMTLLEIRYDEINMIDDILDKALKS